MLFTNHLRRGQSGKPLFLLSCAIENVAPGGLALFFWPEDVLVFLGDYIDRGYNSRGCLERIVRLREDADFQVVALPSGVTSKAANGVAQDVVLIYPAFS